LIPYIPNNTKLCTKINKFFTVGLFFFRTPEITRESLSTVIVEAEELEKEGSGVDSEDPFPPWVSSSNGMTIT